MVSVLDVLVEAVNLFTGQLAGYVPYICSIVNSALQFSSIVFLLFSGSNLPPFRPLLFASSAPIKRELAELRESTDAVSIN